MTRLICLALATVMSLCAADAMAAPVHKKPHGWKGYGFLPGYRQPLNNSVPLFMQKQAVLKMAKRDQRHWYVDPTPQYYNWYNGNWRYPGRPGFDNGGRYNGGSFGPCYTRTPIGPVWTCG